MSSSAVRTATYSPLIDQLWPAGTFPALRIAALMILGSLLLTASAKAQVPMWPAARASRNACCAIVRLTYDGSDRGAAQKANARNLSLPERTSIHRIASMSPL